MKRNVLSYNKTNSNLLRKSIKEFLLTTLTLEKYIFYNEFSKNSFTVCQNIQIGESLSNYQNRLMAMAMSSLQFVRPTMTKVICIVVDVTDPTYVSCRLQYPHMRFMFLKEFCASLHPPPHYFELLETLTQAYTSTLAKAVSASASAPAASVPRHEYHLSLYDVVHKLKNKSILQGVIHMSKHNNREAVVVVRDQGDTSIVRSVAVFGHFHLNRAMHGDLVAIELLPRSEWRDLSLEMLRPDPGAGAGADAEDEVSDISSLDLSIAEQQEQQLQSAGVGAGASVSSQLVMPCAKVVSVMKRATDELVVTVPLSVSAGAGAGAGAGGLRGKREFILAAPLDRRYPLIRVQSKQLAELRGQHVVGAGRVGCGLESAERPCGQGARKHCGLQGEVNLRPCACCKANTHSLTSNHRGP